MLRSILPRNLFLSTACWFITAANAVLAPLQAQDFTESSDPLNAVIGLPQVEPVDPVSSALPTVGLVQEDSAVPLTLDQLSDRIASIEEQLRKAQVDKEAAELNKKQAKLGISRKDAFDPANEKWSVKLGGHVQMDYINWVNASSSIVGDQDYFEFRRLRLVANGTGYHHCDFRLQMTLEQESLTESQTTASVLAPEVKDAYFSVNEIPLLGRFRVGNFFVPFSLEQVTNDTMNIFVERSIPTQGVFSADREIGMALYNASQNERLTWTGGFFFDGITDGLKERIDDNQGYRLSGRVTWLPFYDDQSNGRHLLHTGFGVLHTDDQDKRVRFRTRPQIHEGPRLIDSGVLDADRFTTGNLETAIVNGPISLQSESFLSTVDLLNGDNIQVAGSYVYASYFLTGENRVFEKFGQHGAQFGRIVPNRNFHCHRDIQGPGAWELKSRWSYLDLSRVGAGQYNDLTVGVNWYWSDRTRIMLDWIHPITSSAAVFGSANADILATRFDFNW